MRRAVLAAAVGAVLLGGAAPSMAQDAQLDRLRTARELSDDLMSPFCPGRTLSDCPSPDAAAVRQEIRDSLAAGESPEQVRSRIEGRFGDQVVGVPRSTRGWLAPLAVLVLVAAGFVVGLRRIVRAPDPEPAEIPDELEAEIERLFDDDERGLG